MVYSVEWRNSGELGLGNRRSFPWKLGR